MTSIDTLLTDLTSRDIRLWVEDGRLRFSAPEGAMTAPLRQELKQRKEELLALLSVAPAPAEPEALIADPDNAHAPFPLTRIQQAYWVGRGNPDSFELGGVSAHVYFELDGQRLDLARLEWAWNTLVQRHGMLRAVVDADGRQRVLPEVPEYRVAVSDMAAATPAEVDAHVAAVRAELAQYVAPADRWPLFAIRATRLRDDKLRLHISFDGLVFDASSILLLSREAWQLYTAGRDTLPKLDLTFRDYVLAETRMLAGAEYQRARSYWEARLDTLPPAPDLPLAQPMSSLGVPVFRRRSFVLDAEAWTGLKVRARAAGLTPSALLVSAFADVVALWAREPRFTINLSLFNRQPLHAQVGDVVGDFTTLTLLEVDTASAPLFVDRAKAVQARLWQDMDHKAMSGVEVLGLMGRRRGWDGRAAMPVVFTSALSLDAVEGGAEDLCPFGTIGYGITQTPQVLLDVLAVEHRGALHYAWDAVEDAFPPGLLDQMFEAYGALVRHLAEDAASLVSLTRYQPDWRYPTPPTRPVSGDLLHEGFFAAAREKPEAIAILTGCNRLTFGDVAIRSGTLATLIFLPGIRPAEPVAVLMEKGWQQVVAVLGILAAGGAYVPIEAAWPASRRDRILQKTGARIVVVAAGQAADLVLPDGCIAIEVPDDAPAEMPALPAIQTRPDDLAYVIFTSGSTGEPKGVMISHRAAVNTNGDVNARWSVGPDDRVLALSALGFDLSVYDIFGVLAAGGTVVMPDAGHDRDPAHWHDLMRQHGVTLWNSVPALMAMLTEYLSAERHPADNTLRLAMLSGDWIPLPLPDAIRREFPSCSVVSLGGATEAAIWSIFHPVDAVGPGWTSIPYGRPLANQDVRVLDHDLATRPPWAIGELFIAGQGVAQGYWGDAELTAQRFVTHPVTGERLYRTGDFGRYRPDGVIEFLGREDRQVKIGGFRIELGEIESALRQLPGIADAAVEAVGSDRANRRLVAYLVRAEAEAPATVSEDQRYKASRPGVRTDLGGTPSIVLPKPEDGEAQLKDYLTRQSFREFAGVKIQLADFAALLHAVCSRPMAGAPVPKRRYASGGGLYPVQVYVSVKPDRIEGVACGLYYLDPDGGALRQLSDRPATDAIHGDYNRGFVGAAAFDLFLVGNPDVVAASYPGLARDFCLIEAGAISHLLHERAPDIGMGLCGIGSVAFDALRETLGLDPRHELLHALVGGPIAPEQLSRWGAVVPHQDGPTDSAVLDHAARQLPAYMVPRQIVWLDRLPLSANGKIDRKALPPVSEQISRSVPSPVTESPATVEQAGSRAALDDIVARCVEQVLGYQPVDRTRNLFDLGADSLKIIQIRNRIVASTNRPVGVLDFFRHPTVMLMAEKLQSISDQPRQ